MPPLPQILDLPETIVEPDGTVLRRDVRPFTVRYKGFQKVVDLPGYYPEGDGESVHIGSDSDEADAALRDLKALAEAAEPAPAAKRRAS